MEGRKREERGEPERRVETVIKGRGAGRGREMEEREREGKERRGQERGKGGR